MSAIYRFLREKLFFPPIPRQLNNKPNTKSDLEAKF